MSRTRSVNLDLSLSITYKTSTHRIAETLTSHLIGTSNTVKRAVRETLILWAGLLLCGGLALLLLALSPSRQWLAAQTGETDFLPQVKGLTDLAGGMLRPQPQLAPQEVTDHAGVSRFGINVFLEQ